MEEPKRYVIENGCLQRESDGNLYAANDPIILSWKRSHEAMEKLEEILRQPHKYLYFNRGQFQIDEWESQSKPVIAPDLVTAIEQAAKGAKQ